MLLRAAYLVDVQSHTAVRGLPFKAPPNSPRSSARPSTDWRPK
jgi:hypothetical protein